MTRTAVTGAPDSDLEGEALESMAPPVNPETGEETPENGREKTKPQARERLQSNFVKSAFKGQPSLEDFKGVRKPTKKERDAFRDFEAFRKGREKQAEGVRTEPGQKVTVTKTGAIQVRDARGRIVRSVAAGFRNPSSGRFEAPLSPSVKIEDRDAFNQSVRDTAEKRGDDFLGMDPTPRQREAFEEAIFRALGV